MKKLIFLYLIFNSYIIHSETHNMSDLILKEEYNKYVNLITKSNRSGYRTIEKFNGQGDLVDALGFIAIEGEGYFRVKDYFTGKYFFTRNGSVEIRRVLLLEENYNVYNYDFKIYEIENESDLDHNIELEDIQFTIWKPIGEIRTADGLYYEFDNYIKASGKVIYNKRELPFGTIQNYLNNIRYLIIEIYYRNIIEEEDYFFVIQNIEILEINYSDWIYEIYYLENMDIERCLINVFSLLYYFYDVGTQEDRSRTGDRLL